MQMTESDRPLLTSATCLANFERTLQDALWTATRLTSTATGCCEAGPLYASESWDVLGVGVGDRQIWIATSAGNHAYLLRGLLGCLAPQASHAHP